MTSLTPAGFDVPARARTASVLPGGEPWRSRAERPEAGETDDVAGLPSLRRAHGRSTRRTGLAAALALVIATALVSALALAGPVVPAGTASQPAPAGTLSSQPAPFETLRVMVVGDSVSQGFGGDAPWRYWFWREFRRQGVPIDLVGPHRQPTGKGARYESRRLSFDRDHAARAGSTVDYHRKRIDGLMARYTPHVVVVELGINDAIHGDSAAQVADDLRSLLERIWAASPQTRVVLAELPVYPRDRAVDRVAAAANTRLDARYGDDPRVLMVRNRTDRRHRWDPVKVTFDGLHLNSTGQTLLAQRIAEAFRRGGMLPAAPRIYHARPWRPGVVPRVHRKGRRVTIDWSAAVGPVKMASVQVVIRRSNGRLVRGHQRFAADTGSVTRRLPRGTYRVLLSPRRGTMTGKPVPVTFRVP